MNKFFVLFFVFVFLFPFVFGSDLFGLLDNDREIYWPADINGEDINVGNLYADAAWITRLFATDVNVTDMNVAGDINATGSIQADGCLVSDCVSSASDRRNWLNLSGAIWELVRASLNVDGDITSDSDIFAGNNLGCTNDLDVGDDAIVRGDLNVVGDTGLMGDLWVEGVSYFADAVEAFGTITAGTFTDGTASMSAGNITDGAGASMAGGLIVGTSLSDGTAVLTGGGLSAPGDSNFGSLQVDDLYVTDLTATGDVVFEGDSNFVNLGVSERVWANNIYATGDSNLAGVSLMGGSLWNVDRIECDTCTASGANSVALGDGSVASGTSSFAIGSGTTADNTYATAMGWDTISSGSASTSMGHDTEANGGYSVAGGRGSIASSTASIALGDVVLADGFASVAMGYHTNALNIGSVAIGYESPGKSFISDGLGSIAMGYSDNVLQSSGKGSVALGYNVKSLGEASVALGKDVTCYNDNQVCVQDLNVLGDANIANLTISGITFTDGGISVIGDSNFSSIGVSDGTYLNNLVTTGSNRLGSVVDVGLGTTNEAGVLTVKSQVGTGPATRGGTLVLESSSPTTKYGYVWMGNDDFLNITDITAPQGAGASSGLFLINTVTGAFKGADSMFKIDSSGNYSSAASIVAGTSGVDLTFGGNAGATKASSGSAGDGGDFYWLGGAGGNGVGFGDVDGGDAGDGIVDSGVFGTKLNAGTDGLPGYVLIAPTNATGTLFGTTNTALLTGTNIAYFDESIDVNGDVNILGNINAFDGNANVNFILGTAWYHNHAGMTLNFDTANTWYKFNMTTNNRLNGFHMVDGNFQVEESGLYRIDYSADGKGANNHVYLTTIMVNDVNKDNCSSYQTLPAANDYIPMHGFCYLDLLAGDYVTLAVMDDGGTSTGTVYNYDVAIERKGVYGLGN